MRTGELFEYREIRLEGGWRNKSQARMGDNYAIEKCQSDLLLEEVSLSKTRQTPCTEEDAARVGPGLGQLLFSPSHHDFPSFLNCMSKGEFSLSRYKEDSNSVNVNLKRKNIFFVLFQSLDCNVD